MADDDGDSASDPAVAMSNVQYPSSAGLTFAVAPEIDRLLVTVEAARYEESEAGSWRRLQVGPVELEIAIDVPGSQQLEVVPGLALYYRSREVRGGACTITVVLLNTLEGEFGNKDTTSFFQASFTVRGAEEKGAPFVARVERIDVDDEDLHTNALLFRDHPEFAIGHGCSAEWEQLPGERRATVVSATFMPLHDVAIMEPNPDIPDNELGFDDLSSAQPDELDAALESFLAGYTKWIEERQAEALTLDERYRQTATSHLADCAEARDRIGAGIEVLGEDPDARRAFQLANRAMADQMERASKADGVDRSIFRWRPFQLAFVLVSLPSVVDPQLPDRSIAELLWFPTGGGKTEAYLGLFAFTVFHRRITRGGAAGVTAIMRYTLRLLTIPAVRARGPGRLCLRADSPTGREPGRGSDFDRTVRRCGLDAQHHQRGPGGTRRGCGRASRCQPKTRVSYRVALGATSVLAQPTTRSPRIRGGCRSRVEMMPVTSPRACRSSSSTKTFTASVRRWSSARSISSPLCRGSPKSATCST